MRMSGCGARKPRRSSAPVIANWSFSKVNGKKQTRLRRARRGRMKMRELGVRRLTVHRTSRHIYAQVMSPDGANVLAAASTLDAALCSGATGNVQAAARVGALVAERARRAGVQRVAFDRSGYKFHGRVRALAEAARAGGLEF